MAELLLEVGLEEIPARMIADAQTEVVLLVFGEFNVDAATLGADKLIELPMFERRKFALNTLGDKVLDDVGQERHHAAECDQDEHRERPAHPAPCRP